jgi:hypothetical protein
VEGGFSRKDRAPETPELRKPLAALHCFAFRRQVMINTPTRSGGAAPENIAQATLANAIGRLGSLFFAGLQHLYAAHTEKVQMRFAPIRCGRVVKRPHPFGL